MLSFARTLALVFAASTAQFAAADVAIYSGSFDPPTRTHIALIRDALKRLQPGDQFVVIVNRGGPKNFRSSVSERVSLLKAGLGALANRIDFQALTPVEKDAFDGKYPPNEHFIHFIGEDSAAALPKEVVANPNHSWVVYRRPGETSLAPNSLPNSEFRTLRGAAGVSSTQARADLEAGRSSPMLDAAVNREIRAKGQYPADPAAINELQRQLSDQGFQDFLTNLRELVPAGTPLDGIPVPPFDPQQSRAGRTEWFVRWLMSHVPNASPELETTANSLLYTHGFSKIPYLEATAVERRAAPEIRSVVPIALPPPIPASTPHTLNVKAYIDQRVPTALQNTMRNGDLPIYLHNGSIEASLDYHRAAGWSEAFRLWLPRGSPDRSGALVRNPTTGALRLVWAYIDAPDQKYRAIEQFAQIGGKASAIWVDHRTPTKVFEWNAAGEAFRFGEKDRVVIGFKNQLEAAMRKDSAWTITTLTISGVPIDLYANAETGERIVNPRNVYGDEMIPLIESLYRKGARSISLIGTAGSIDPVIGVAHAVAPSAFLDADGKVITIRNEFASTLKSLLPDTTFHTGTTHGWLSGILDETIAHMRALSRLVNTIDIEGRYLYEFLSTHPDVRGGIAFVISDQPLGDLDYVHNNSTLLSVDATVKQIARASMGLSPVDPATVRCVEAISVASP